MDRLNFVKDKEGKIMCEDVKIKERWREYFNTLLNTKNNRNELPQTDPVQGPIENITDAEDSYSIRPILLYGSETWPIPGNLADKIGSCEMRMLRYCLEISLEEHQTNEEIRKQAQVMPIQDLMRKRRLQWFGQVCRRDEEADIRRAVEMQVGGKRKRGRPKHCWKDTIKTDMEWFGLEKEDTDDRDRWRCLVEMKIWQKPATQKEKSGER
ncbi:unnamed protein product [Leuciscus chuanchicus]